ncbi:MAG TPA: peptidylprolyl isomerase [Longimicrobiales bacterium]
MQLRPALSALFVLAAACATAPPSQAPQPTTTTALTPADVGTLAEVLRREDTRAFDAAAFQGPLSSSTEAVRMLSARALGRIGNRGASPQLITALSDASVRVRAEAAFALGELGDSSEAVVTALARIAQNRGVDAAEAVSALGKLRSYAARHYVEHALRTETALPILQEALLAIWRFPRTAATAQLVAPHTRHQDQQVRWRATYALTRGLADPAVVPQLIALLQRDSGYTASFAARGLRAASADSAGQRAQALAALLARVNDAYAPIRINAITAIGGYRDTTAATQLIPLLKHADLNTRVAAAQAIGTSGGSAAWSALEGVARDLAERPLVRGSALTGLMTISSERALPLADAFARSTDWLARLYAARSAGNARADLGLPLLRTLAGDRDARVAVAAVEAAAGTRDTLPAARALFIEQLAANDPFVRAAALNGLARYADIADQILLFDAYARAQRDTVPEAAVAALDAIARLVEKNAAVDRAFRVRFTTSAGCPHADVQQALRRHFQIETDCGFALATRVYEQVVRDYLMPGLNGTNPRARITTAGKVIEIELLAADAPMTVRNFVTLANRRYFDGARWHRVVPNFVIQDGDPYGNGSGGPGYAIRDEMNRVRYLEGAVGMALSGPDTGGSQFFITHSPQPHLDGGYTVFGRVVSGMDGVWAVVQDDAIERIEIVR